MEPARWVGRVQPQSRRTVNPIEPVWTCCFCLFVCLFLQYMRLFENHKVVTFEEMSQSGQPVAQLVKRSPASCPRHPSEASKFYCHTCQVRFVLFCFLLLPFWNYFLSSLRFPIPVDIVPFRSLGSRARGQLGSIPSECLFCFCCFFLLPKFCLRVSNAPLDGSETFQCWTNETFDSGFMDWKLSRKNKNGSISRKWSIRFGRYWNNEGNFTAEFVSRRWPSLFFLRRDWSAENQSPASDRNTRLGRKSENSSKL